MGGADDRQPVLGLRVADRVAAGQRAARLADLGRRAREDRGQHVARQVLGEGRDRQREQHPAAHREDVGQGVRGRDLAERPRVVDERREEVERADDREVVADPVGGGVVGRVRPAISAASGVGGGLGAEARSAPRPAGRRRASRRSRRSRSGRSGGTGRRQGLERRHRPMIRGVPAPAALPSPRERTGPGGSPGLQNQWRGARRGAVGSTPTRSRHGGVRCRPGHRDRRDRPSVERLLAARPRGRRRPAIDADALTAVAREVVDDERARLAGGRAGARRRRARRRRPAAGSTAFADRAGRPDAGHQRDRGRSSTRTWAGRRGRRRRDRRPPTWPRRLPRSSSSTARPAGAARALPRRRGAPHRADRRRGRARHQQQRRGARARGRAGRPRRASSSRAASWSRSAAACGSPRSSGGPARGWSRSGRRTGRAPRTSRRRSPTAGRSVVLRVHPSNFTMAGFIEAPDPAERRRDRPPPRRDRRRRPRQRRAARHRGLRPGPRADARASGWPPAPTSSRSAATSWSAGRRPG